MAGRTIVFPKMLLTVTSPSFSYSSISIRGCTWDKVHPVSLSSLFAFVPLMDPSDTGNLPSCRVFLRGLWSWVQSWHRGSGCRCDQTSGTQNTLGRGLCPTSLGHSTFSRLSSPLWPFVPPGQGVRAVWVRSIASLPVSMELPGLGLYHEPIGKVGASQLRRIMSSGRIPLPYPQHGWARSTFCPFCLLCFSLCLPFLSFLLCKLSSLLTFGSSDLSLFVGLFSGLTGQLTTDILFLLLRAASTASWLFCICMII